MNKVKILFFATLRDLAGAKSFELDVPADMTVQGLKDKLAREHPKLTVAMETVLVAINREYASDDAILPASAEIAMFPPVSGG
jgi:molybdopterin converting factor subunit 1